MKSRLVYVELKSGHGDSGPAWIGTAFYSKTGRTIYFNGQAFRSGQGTSGNFFDAITGEEYWISGVKKDGADRHTFGSGVINIDKSVIPEYLELRGLQELPKSKYNVIELINIPGKQQLNILENQRLTEKQIRQNERWRINTE